MTGPAPHSAAQRRARSYIVAAIERAKMQPLGTRQARILDWLRRHEAGGGAPVSAREVAAGIRYRSGDTDVHTSLVGLAARGLVAPTCRARTRRSTLPSGWRLTAAGR